jgi:hypothetical protein
MAVAPTTGVARTTAKARTMPVLGGIMDGRIPAVARTDPVTGQGMQLTQAPSRSRLAIGRTILAALAIMWAAHITSGDRDTGHRAAVKESGSVATTLCEDNRAGAPALRATRPAFHVLDIKR